MGAGLLRLVWTFLVTNAADLVKVFEKLFGSRRMKGHGGRVEVGIWMLIRGMSLVRGNVMGKTIDTCTDTSTWTIVGFICHT